MWRGSDARKLTGTTKETATKKKERNRTTTPKIKQRVPEGSRCSFLSPLSINVALHPSYPCFGEKRGRRLFIINGLIYPPLCIHFSRPPPQSICTPSSPFFCWSFLSFFLLQSVKKGGRGGRGGKNSHRKPATGNGSNVARDSRSVQKEAQSKRHPLPKRAYTTTTTTHTQVVSRRKTTAGATGRDSSIPSS